MNNSPATMHADALMLLKELVSHPSITPDQTQAQKRIANYLAKHIPDIQVLDAQEQDVPNLVILNSRHKESKCLGFCGHTDVVPTGAEALWKHNPFVLTQGKNGELYGRGVADMKGGLAAFSAAWVALHQQHPQLPANIVMMLTGDEEGPAKHGIKSVVPKLSAWGIRMDACLIGEPTSCNAIGDTARIGRRGSLQAQILITGEAQHVAYATKESNVAHVATKIVNKLVQHPFHDGIENFPDSSLQITQIQCGKEISNITPSSAEISLVVRFSPTQSFETLEATLDQLIGSWTSLNYQIEFRRSASPYKSKKGALTESLVALMQEKGRDVTLNAAGGTSDGRFVATVCDEVLELGLRNDTIHQVNEHTTESDLIALGDLYYQMLLRFFTKLHS